MKLGLVLSGGAAWGLSNIGVLQVLAENGILVDCYAGSSMGAIVAALPAFGVPLDVLPTLASALHPLTIASIDRWPLEQGLHGGIFRQKIREVLHPILGDARLGDSKIPFVCVAGRIMKPIEWQRIVLPGFTEHFLSCVEPCVLPPSMPVIDALLATSAIPVLFNPVIVDNQEYIDLVHFGAIPARRLRDIQHPDVVIGTDTAPRYETLEKWLPLGWRDFLRAGHASLDEDKRSCDVMIEPTMPAGTFRFDRAQAFIEAGRKSTEEALPLILSAIQSSTVSRDKQ